MEKDTSIEKENLDPNSEIKAQDSDSKDNDNNELNENSIEQNVLDLEDKLTRSYAEMENQRRRFEKEKEEAYEYGGFAFAKEALSLIDNLERSKQTLENDDTLKNSEALKKIL